MIFHDSTPPAAGAEPGPSLSLRVGEVRYRVAGLAGSEVAHRPPCLAPPGGPHWLLGVAVHKGEALPLVDLRALLQDTAAGPSGGTRMLVSRLSGCVLGFVVDEVDEDDGRRELAALDLCALGRGLLAAVPDRGEAA